MEAVYAFEISVNFYQISWCYTPEDSILDAFMIYDLKRKSAGRILQILRTVLL
jgi:hypothetical protein